MAMNDELKKDTNKPKKGISTKQVVLICSGTLLAIAAIVAVCVFAGLAILFIAIRYGYVYGLSSLITVIPTDL